MLTLLLRRLAGLPGLILLLALGVPRPVLATHLLGGEMTYRYLDAKGPASAPLRYEITVVLYNNCASTTRRSTASVGIYYQDTGDQVVLTSVNYPNVFTTTQQSGFMSIGQTSITACISPVNPPGCTITGASQPFQLQRFVGVVNLPVSSRGYYALFTDGNRNVDVTNLDGAGQQALSLYASLSSPQLPNSSPVFSDVAVAIICANDTTYLLNNAVDADGDRLVYSFGQPYGTINGLGMLPAKFTPPPNALSYVAGQGYSPTTPLGTAGGSYSSLNPTTGNAKFKASTLGAKYVVAVDVNEYRTINGQEILLGTTRRDLQLVVASCPPTLPPVLPKPVVTPRSYTIEAGASLQIPITATQADGDPLTMTLNSELLDGAGGHAATFDGNPGTLSPGNPAGTAEVTGAKGTVTGTFSFNSACTEARTTPYNVAFIVKDNGCAGKTVGDVLRILVVKPKGPTAIAEPSSACGQSGPQSYTASGGAAPGVSWRVVGGTVVGSSTANPVQVQWGAPGTTGTLVARGVTQYGCLTDSVRISVAIQPVGTLTVAGERSVCAGGSVSLSVTGGAGSFTLTGGPAPQSGPGPFVVSPSQTTTYTLSGPSTNGCPATTQVIVTVKASPVAVPGAAPTTCAGVPVTLGAAAVAGLTYGWAPTAGLSDPKSANPTATLPNATGAPLTQTYTLTVTDPTTTCNSTGTVAVTVNPALVAGTVGSTQAVCPGAAPGPLTNVAGASGGDGTYAYQWESSADNATWTAIAGAGATGLTYVPGPVTAPVYFRRRVSSASCAAAVSNVVAVQLQPALATTVSLAAPTPQCAGTVLTFNPVLANAGATPTYRWLVNGTPVATTATFSSATLVDGDQVRVEVTPTAGSCASGPAVAAVSVSRLLPLQPALSITTPLDLVCPGETLSFSIASVNNPGPAPQYQWQVDGADVPGATGPSFSSATLRDGQLVTLGLRTTNNCGQPAAASSNNQRVSLMLPVVVSAGPDKEIVEGESVALEGSSNSTLPVTWTPAATLSFPAGGNPLRPVAAPTSTTVYTLTAGPAACSGSSAVTVRVLPPIRIPNVFSPNADGQDDTWEIDRIGNFPGNVVTVFNRWGNQVFTTSGYRRGNEWGGQVGGQPAPVGTYYYVITLGNGRSFAGAVTVVY